MAKGDKLTEKQDKFALALFKGDSQRTAYRKAFPNSKKWQDKTVDSKASTLANTDKVLERLNDLRKKAEDKTILSVNQVLAEVGKIAIFDIRDLYHPETGELLQPHQLSDNAAAVVAGLKNRTELGEESVSSIDEYKTYDKTKALDMLMKHHGLYEKDNKRDIIATVEQVTKLPVRDPNK